MTASGFGATNLMRLCTFCSAWLLCTALAACPACLQGQHGVKSIIIFRHYIYIHTHTQFHRPVRDHVSINSCGYASAPRLHGICIYALYMRVCCAASPPDQRHSHMAAKRPLFCSVLHDTAQELAAAEGFTGAFTHDLVQMNCFKNSDATTRPAAE